MVDISSWQDIVNKTSKLQDKIRAIMTTKESTLKERGEAENRSKAKVALYIRANKGTKLNVIG